MNSSKNWARDFWLCFYFLKYFKYYVLVFIEVGPEKKTF